MVTSPTKKGVVILGGTCSKAMFELNDSMKWTHLEKTLQHDYFGPFAIPIPDSLTVEISTAGESEICTCMRSTCTIS